MTKAFLFAIVFSPLMAQAALTGRYMGTGTAVFPKSGTTRVCSQIFLDIKQDAKTFTLNSGGYSCEDLSAGIDPYVLQIRAGHVFEGVKDVGTISENRIELFENNPSEGYTFRWTQERTPAGLVYTEEWTDGAELALVIKGVLQPL